MTWRLEPEGHGTRLFVAHAGFDLDDPGQEFAFRGLSSGWPGTARRVAAVLATDDP